MQELSCAACGEVKKLRARGLCGACYQRSTTAGTLSRFGCSRRNFTESYALAQANETASGCWPWPTATVTGYPTGVKFGGRPVLAHEVAWLRTHGPVPAGLTLDHRCHTDDPTCSGGPADPHRRCVRPDHLQLASRADQRRWQHKYRAPHCRNGHPRNDVNVRMVTKRTKDGKSHVYRACRVCQRESTARQRERGVAG